MAAGPRGAAHRGPRQRRQLVEHYTTDRDPAEVADPAWAETTGFGTAGDVYARHLALDGPWLGGSEETDEFTGELVGSSPIAAVPAVLALAAATALAWRARQRAAVLLAGQVALGLAVGFVVAARVDGYALPYLFGWLEVLVLLLWLSVGWSLFSVLRDRRADASEPVTRVLAGAAVVVSLLTTVDAVSIDGPFDETDQETVDQVADEVIRAAGPGPVFVLDEGNCVLKEAAYGIALELEREGVEVRVPAGLENRFGQHRVSDGSDVERQVTVVCNDAVDAALAGLDERPGTELAAVWDPVEDLRDQEADIRRRITDELDVLGRSDLAPQVRTGEILYTGPGAGVSDQALGPLRRLLVEGEDRIAVLVGPPAR